jgi:signal transduction histidine kinase
VKARARKIRQPGHDISADELARHLHDTLGQHLVGVTLETDALARTLNGRQAPESQAARLIVEHLRSATQEITRLITWLDHGQPR